MTILDRFSSAIADQYAINREIGGSAVAIAYLAEDRAHRVEVTVKLVRPAVALALAADRFVGELKYASQLQHPYIVPLYEWGEADGFLYYVTPLVEGDSLRDRLRREKQLPVDDAIRITRGVATALNFAHSHQVVHHDIRPENVLLPAGTTIVAEFGIARAVVAAGTQRITPGWVGLGTPAYMSPEQARGEAKTDGRSDIYALACVLYEMLVGEPPFTGATIERIVEQHLSGEPPDVTTVRGVPDQLARGIKKALAKSAGERFATAAEFAEALTGSNIPLAASGQQEEPTRRPRSGHKARLALGLVLIAVVLGALALGLI